MNNVSVLLPILLIVVVAFASVAGWAASLAAANLGFEGRVPGLSGVIVGLGAVLLSAYFFGVRMTRY